MRQFAARKGQQHLSGMWWSGAKPLPAGLRGVPPVTGGFRRDWR